MRLYQFLSIILSPLIDLYLIYRKFKSKEDKSRFKERLGFASLTRPKGKLIWIHGASVGESNSILPLIDRLLKEDQKSYILLTSGTVTSAQQIAKKLPKRAFHQFVPIDKLSSVKRFLKHWKPDVAMFVESEIWPNLIDQSKKSGAKLVLVNGRMSERSYKRWKGLDKIDFNILKNFDICFTQSKKDQGYFKNLGVESYFVGNLKAVQMSAKINETDHKILTKEIGERPFWLAASTHKGEEEIVVETHKKLKELYPNILTIIAPRHPVRSDEILSIIDKELKISTRSKKQKINKNTDIYLANTLGELGLFYKLAKFSFIGGSLFKDIGGHNPFEAINLGCLPISGVHVENFKEIYSYLEQDKLCIMIKDENDLFAQLVKLLDDEKYYQSMLKQTDEFKRKNDEILDEVMNRLLTLATIS